MTDLKPLAWLSADMSSAITARQLENIPELGGDPSQLYPISLYPKEAVMTDKASIRPDMVRELEWRPETPYHVARVFGNIYAVEGHDDGATLSGIGGRRELSSVAEAKAAAQADYATRIASALSPAFLERIAAMEAEKEQWREAARCVVGADLPKYLRTLVAGWNGDGRPDGERFGRHPVTLGATIPTTCGAVYELDEALRCLAALTGIEVAPAPRNEV